MSKCPNCSGENTDSQHFCGDCGTPLPPGAHQTQSYPESTRDAIEQNGELITGTLFAKRYQVIEKLGTGGMGRVYRVTDKTLGEEIALKLIRPEIAGEKETLERFKVELKLARLVVHKNVARMFDLSVEDRIPYITMEYVRGEDLKRLLRKVGHLFAGQAIPIACQICEGLAEAHKLGIVHRDLKPQNIMIDEEGKAKIMDFGLARLLRTGEDKKRHETGGTPAYMSPEQVRGERLDGRSDLYSMGVLLYEMLTGTLPFEGKSVRELAQKHLSEPPVDPCELNPGISAGLSQVVIKCLEKDPEKRFQSAEEVQVALNCLASSVKPPLPPKQPTWIKLAKIAGLATAAVLISIFVIPAIFPPDDLSKPSRIAVLQASSLLPDLRDAGFDRELQEAVSRRLSGIPLLTVISSLTVNAVDTEGKTTRQIARRLKADYLIDLSFRAEGSLISLTAKLINAGLDNPVKNYLLDKNTGDLSSVKDEFARGISIILPGDVVEDRRGKPNRGITSNLEARLLFHEGMRLIEEIYPDKRSQDVFEEAVGKYKKALGLDPEYALALWALGNAYEARYFNTRWDRRDPQDFDKMCAYYQDAYNKNPDSSETMMGLGWAHFNKGEFSKAFDLIKDALESEPKNPIVNQDVGAFLRSIGLYRQAIRYLSRAASLDPHNPDIPLLISLCLQELGRFGEAADMSEKVVREDANNIRARQYHAFHLILDRRFNKAELEITAIRGINADFKLLPATEALLAAARGERARALDLWGEGKIINFQGTYFYLLLGMKEEAIANIEAGIKLGFDRNGEYLYPYPALMKNPCYGILRDNVRFKEIVKEQKSKYLGDFKKFKDL